MVSYQLIGVFVCLVHSALFSGLNLGLFGISRLRLEVQAESGNTDAKNILELRKDAHFLLATILWGNVSSNVLLTILTDSVMTGVAAFLISTFVITFFGEMLPQAYFARHILKASAVLIPIIRVYQMILYPIAKPTALVLDVLLGKEQVIYFQEKEIIVMLQRQALEGSSDIAHLESLGAVNFLALDDIRIEEEGERINPASIVALHAENHVPVFPDFKRNQDDPFLQMIQASKEKWVILTDMNQSPLLVLDADHFLREAMYGKEMVNIKAHCHRPLLVTQAGTTLGQVIHNLKVNPEHLEDDVIDQDIILYWNKDKRIITGADILGRLLRGIAKHVKE